MLIKLFLMNTKDKFIVKSAFGGVIIAFLLIIAIKSGFVIPTQMAKATVDSINEMIISLCLSYIAGYIFYLLLNVLPRKVEQRKIKELINADLKKIFDVSTLFCQLMMHKCDEFESNKLTNEFCSSYIYSFKRNSCYEYINISDFKYLSYVKNGINERLGFIINVPNISTLDSEFISLLIKIRTHPIFTKSMTSFNIQKASCSFNKKKIENFYGIIKELKRYTDFCEKDIKEVKINSCIILENKLPYDLIKFNYKDVKPVCEQKIWDNNSYFY